MKNPLKPDDGKPFTYRLSMKTPTDLYMEGHDPLHRERPTPGVVFTGKTHRNWLMRRPAGRILVSITLLLLILWVIGNSIGN